MAKHIRHISAPIEAYLSQQSTHAFHGKKDHNGKTLPPHLEWMRLRGEAFLVKRFFSYFEQHHIHDVNSQLFFWEQFKSNPEALPLLSLRTGLIAIFKTQVGQAYLEQTPEHEQHSVAYCCLLWDIHQQKNHTLLNTVTDVFFGYFAATIFPPESRQHDTNKIKQEISKQLARLWNIRPDIRESFSETEEGISFSLIARMNSHAPHTLITLNGKRLKPTRLKACQMALQQLEQGTIDLEPPNPVK